MEPNACEWQPWVLASGDEVRPGPPLAYDSPELAVELQEVKIFTRTFATNQKSMWWQAPDGAFESWCAFANLRLFESRMDANPPYAAHLYTMMVVPQYDGVIAVWDAKYAYWSFRPFQMDQTLTTIFPTPNYPSASGMASTSASRWLLARRSASS